MILIKTLPKTPKQRWKRYLQIHNFKKSFFKLFYKIKTKNKKALNGRILINNIKFFYNRYLYKFIITKSLPIPTIIHGIGAKYAPVKEFAWGKNVYNQISFFIHNTWFYPGYKIFNYITLKYNNYTLLNQILPLNWVPINSLISFIFNSKNNYMTYAKSSGSTALKRKTEKKQKLSYVELPSKQIKLFPSYTFCNFSENKNCFVNKIVEGGWGFTQKTKKLITVRGVAKNPVDHPNGGRTKAKQPELSPWGWVAKKCK